MPLTLSSQWTADVYLIVGDKNNQKMIRKIPVNVEFDPGNPASDTRDKQEDLMIAIIGEAILIHSNNTVSVDPADKLTYMGVAEVVLGQKVLASDLATYITGYENVIEPVAELPERFVVDYPMYRRAKYSIRSNCSSGVGYIKTPENTGDGDPIGAPNPVELPAFPILTVAQSKTGFTKLHTDWKRNFWFLEVLQNDHVQATGGRV